MDSRTLLCYKWISVVLLMFILDSVKVIQTKEVCTQKDNFHCTYYSKYKDYYCTQKWTKSECKFMCGLCDFVSNRTKIGECKKFDHAYCTAYEAHKDYYCSQAWMREHCKILCGYCPSPSKVNYGYGALAR